MERVDESAAVMSSGLPRQASILRNWRGIGLALIILIAVLAPFFISNYRMFQFTFAFSYAIVLLGLNMLTGYNGQISLGHSAFYAIGAYTAAILMDRWNVPYPLTLV